MVGGVLPGDARAIREPLCEALDLVPTGRERGVGRLSAAEAIVANTGGVGSSSREMNPSTPALRLRDRCGAALTLQPLSEASDSRPVHLDGRNGLVAGLQRDQIMCGKCAKSCGFPFIEAKLPCEVAVRNALPQPDTATEQGKREGR
jgi:hypothetical protein